MKTPLMVYATHELLIIAGKKISRVSPPGKPYIISTKEFGKKSDRLTLTDLRTRKSRVVYRTDFLNDRDAEKTARGLRNDGIGVHHIRFLESIYVDHPDFFLKFPNGEPDTMALDIEVLSNGTGTFPNANTSPIISIGAQYMDEEPQVFEISKEDLEGPYPDAKIMKDFLNFFHEKNPDIILTYNGIRFDIPYIITRANHNGIDLSQFSRIRSSWETSHNPRIPGHIHYDIYESDTSRDQSLAGIKNKKLKTIAKWYKIHHIELSDDEIGNTRELIGTSKLTEYQKSDVRILRDLYKIYIPLHTAISEMMGIPLDSVINDYPSFIPKIVCTRELRKAGYVALENNAIRYHEIEGKYQAAFVDIFKNGFIPKVYKLDFSGFYPSTMVNLNLSPETVSLVKIDKFTNADDFKFTLKDSVLWCQIPDSNLNKNLIIKINQEKEGLISKRLTEMMKSRFALKDKMKTVSLDEAKKIKAITDAQKVLCNSIYGSMALANTEYGDLSVAIATVGICRWIIKQVMNKLGDCVVELDSVTGQTPICIRRDRKFIDFIPIEELIPAGCHRYFHVPKNIEALTRHGWKGINYVKRHKSNKKIYRLNTTNGYVEITEDHSLFTKEQEEITPCELHIGDEIELKNIPVFNVHTDISESFAWFLGFLLAEGSVTIDTKPRYQVVFSNQNLNLLNKANEIFESRYMESMKLYDTRESSNCYKLEKDHKFAATELKHLCYTKLGRKKVPLQILNGSRDIKTAFLKGLWDGDGYISISQKQHIESIDSIHHTLLAGIQYLVNSLGQKSGIVIRSDKPNVLTLKKRMPRSHSVKVNENLVKKLDLLDSSECEVYDISTEDGTFVCGIGGIVLHNTDGIFTDEDIDIDATEKFVYDLVRPLTLVKDLRISMDKDIYGSGFFHLSKNYLLRELKEGRIIYHGVAFKAASHCILYDKIISTVGEMILEQESEDTIWKKVSEYLNLSKYPLDDFIMTTRLNKPVQEYATENCLQMRLARQLKKVLGIDPYVGIQVEYVVTKGKNYKMVTTIKDRSEIDNKYYTEEIYKALKLFGLQKIHQSDLFRKCL